MRAEHREVLYFVLAKSGPTKYDTSRCPALTFSALSEPSLFTYIPKQHMFNEMYARDISRKIKASLQVRMEEGSFIGNFAPYGYQKSQENKHRLIPDPAASIIVKRIFDDAAAGCLPAKIAETLNDEHVLPPSLYRCKNNQKLNPCQYTSHGQWTANTIIKLLHNPVYLGHMVQGKSKKLSFKSSLTLPVPPSKRISVRRTHTPLISEKTFAACEAQLSQRACRRHP